MPNDDRPANWPKTSGIDPTQVSDFFRDRGRRLAELGPLHAVIYQEKQADLAQRRDEAEARMLLPLLNLKERDSLLDIGCGTGRWANRVAMQVERYLGVDYSPDFIEHARRQHQGLPSCEFIQLPVERLAEIRHQHEPFTRMLCAGVCIYLNDDQLKQMLEGLRLVSDSSCRLIMREPVGIESRLTLSHHYSTELEHHYSAIYRTEPELQDSVLDVIGASGFGLVASGDVYTDSTLNNRAETRQRWIVFEKPAR